MDKKGETTMGIFDDSLPPGVTDEMIPWNTPEDESWWKWLEENETAIDTAEVRGFLGIPLCSGIESIVLAIMDRWCNPEDAELELPI